MSARSSLAVLVLLLAASLLAACSSDDDPPPRSPLGDTSPPPPSPTAAPTLPPTVTPTSAQSEPTPPSAAALEVFTGNAIELMAEWLGVPATDLAVAEAEALVWPDACLGIPRPLLVCDQALTPGARILLEDPFGGAHAVHADASGAVVAWAGQTELRGSIEQVDVAERRITLATLDGDILELRVAPGSLIEARAGEPGLAAAAPGLPVVVAYDPPPDGAGPPVVAWLDADPSR